MANFFYCLFQFSSHTLYRFIDSSYPYEMESSTVVVGGGRLHRIAARRYGHVTMSAAMIGRSVRHAVTWLHLDGRAWLYKHSNEAEDFFGIYFERRIRLRLYTVRGMYATD